MAATILLLLLSSSSLAAVADIPVGSSLSSASASPWRSPSRRFAFGFYKEGAGFGVGIWLESSGSKMFIVWTANRNDTPVSADSNLALTKDGLLLRSDGAKVNLISAQITPGLCSYASLLDSGNLILYNSTNQSIWQSFDCPTDTILGGQTLGSGQQLFSSATEEDHSEGRFRLSMQQDSNLVMYPAKSMGTPDDSYWSSNTYLRDDGWELHLYEDGSLFFVSSNGSKEEELRGLNSSHGAFIPRATLDTDGIFRLYAHSSSDGSVARAVDLTGLEGTCNVKGFCGPNSYCSLANDHKPKCFCPPGYSFTDPTREVNGCDPDFRRKSCGNTTYAISTIDSINWESSPYSVLELERDECKNNCLNDCICDAAVFQRGKCLKLSLPLVYGRNKTEPSSTIVFFIKIGVSAANGSNSDAKIIGVSGNGSTRTADSSSSRKVKIIAGVLASCLVILLLSISSFLILRNRARWLQHTNTSDERNVGLLEEILLRSFSYDELVEATHNFREEVGSGGFGTVYRGSLYKGERSIAVKRLKKVAGEGGEREFQAEMRAIGRTHHKNLVRLLGFCDEGSSRLLVYDYMSNGSLADLLFGSNSKTRPEWSERVRIVQDVAKGISYLHEDCNPNIIHCDIKPQNILMDEFWTAKISDFGLAKQLMPDQSRTETRTRGTTAYLAPEWRKNLAISVKVDVYSFGIVLLETVCCRKNIDPEAGADEIVLWEWAYSCLMGGALRKLTGDEADERMLERMVKVGLWCIQEEPALRPSMKHVVLMLEGNMETPLPPSPISSTNIL